MNAARPFATPFSSASLGASGTSIPSSETPLSKTPLSKTPAKNSTRAARTRGARGAKSAARGESPTQGDEYLSCLKQARICREQAQEAARLKRFKAAVGLFQTAVALCQRAVLLRPRPIAEAIVADEATSSSEASSSSDGEAREYLQVLAVELSAYDELARSMDRPLMDRARP